MTRPVRACRPESRVVDEYQERVFSQIQSEEDVSSHLQHFQALTDIVCSVNATGTLRCVQDTARSHQAAKEPPEALQGLLHISI